MNLALARAVADAVLYEGYLLYPYRASSAKNQVRWQFGVLGPPGAAEAGVGEESSMSMQCMLKPSPSPVDGKGSITIHLRFLQLQRRQAYDEQDRPLDVLRAGDDSWLSWDEAVEQEVAVPVPLDDLAAGVTSPVTVAGGAESERPTDGTPGRLTRRRWPLTAQIQARTLLAGSYTRLEVRVDNVTSDPGAVRRELTKESAERTSLIGAHLLLEAHGVEFVSLLEPPEEARAVVEDCIQHRCWPVLAGAPGDTDLVLGSAIILYDYPQIAAQSAGALFDATEIDEILTLRVMTMTDQEKAEARATDPRAAEIIDRCDAMAPETLQQLHGILRNPHAPEGLVGPWFDPGLDGFDVGGSAFDLPTSIFDTELAPWWDPAADASLRPDVDGVVIDGVRIARGSLVRVHPSRRADAQDLFFADQVARVGAVLSDVDGEVHVALVLVDDPAAELHEEAGRYFYFGPDELEPLRPSDLSPTSPSGVSPAKREEAS
jgi:hypothetical protein